MEKRISNMAEFVEPEKVEARKPIGTLWIGTDLQGRQTVSGEIENKRVYGYINEVTVKRGKNIGKKVKNIKIYLDVSSKARSFV